MSEVQFSKSSVVQEFSCQKFNCAEFSCPEFSCLKVQLSRVQLSKVQMSKSSDVQEFSCLVISCLEFSCLESNSVVKSSVVQLSISYRFRTLINILIPHFFTSFNLLLRSSRGSLASAFNKMRIGGGPPTVLTIHDYHLLVSNTPIPDSCSTFQKIEIGVANSVLLQQ